MAQIFPFRALRPKPEVAAQVAAVPYDVVNRQEARALAADNPHSFLHVTRPDIDLDDTVGAYDAAVYDQGAKALKAFMAQGILVRDTEPNLYLYELTMDGSAQTGIVCCASVDEYRQNIVRKHEFTRPDKEDDRVRNIEVLKAQSGTVFLAHKDSPAIATIVARIKQNPPIYDFIAADNIGHRVWRVSSKTDIAGLIKGFADLGPIYIADGHHRSAAAARVADTQPDNPLAQQFLAVSFPASELRILPYNRVVKDLNGQTPEQFLQNVGQRFRMQPGKPVQLQPKQFAMYLAGAWYTLDTPTQGFDPSDPVARLDVSILQAQLLEPILGIKDPRRDQRIEFVGGIRGDAELEQRVNNGAAVAFSLHATGIDDLFAIADAEQVMPPKSTWFEPKLRDGLFVHRIQ